MSTSTPIHSEIQVQILGHVARLLPAIDLPAANNKESSTNEIQTTTASPDMLQPVVGEPKTTQPSKETSQEPQPHVINHALHTPVKFFIKDPRSFRKIQEEEGWTKLRKDCRRRSPTEHLDKLRRPHAWERNGWKNCASVLFNRSDTFARFLNRSAILKVSNTVRKWREICCQKECCKDKLCVDECCKEKEDKKMKDSSEFQRRKHLMRQLHAFGEDVRQWYSGRNRASLVEEAIAAFDLEMSWRSCQGDLEKAWVKNLEYVKQEMEEKMEAYGLSLSDLHDLEAALVEAEKEEETKIEEQERLEKEKLSAVYEQAGDEEDDNDDEVDDFPHLYADVLPPLRTPTNRMSLCEQEITAASRPVPFNQLENGPLKLPLTPTEKIPLSRPKMTADDEFGMFLIDAYINDLIEEQGKYNEKHGFNFHPCWLNKPSLEQPYNLCTWKLHPVSDFILDCSLPPSQKYPEIRVTDPEGNVFTVEERLPVLQEDSFKDHCIARYEWGLAVDELIRRGCTFEQGRRRAVRELRESGWEPRQDDKSDESDDDEDDLELTYLEASKEFDIMEMESADNKDEMEDEFSQEITYLEPGQEFDITDSESATESCEDPELPLINAFINNVHKRQRFYQNCSNDQFWWAITESNKPPTQLSLKNCCPWKRHLLSDFVKDLPPQTSQLFPDIRVTDPEGNVYSLEERAAVMDEDFDCHVAERDAWQLKKEISLEENKEETEKEYSTRLQHFLQWETEFRQIDGQWAVKEKMGGLEPELSTPTPPEEIDTRTNLEKARDAIQAFDTLVRECLFEVKQEFIHTTKAKWKASLAKEKEPEEGGWELVGRLSRTLVRLREKLEVEGMLRLEKGGTTYVGAWGEGVYWVEMKGDLAEVWSKFRLGGED